MTLIELVVVLLWGAASVGGSAWAGARLGPAGFVGGFVAVAVGIPVVLRVIEHLDARFFMGPSAAPPCKCGREGSRQQLVLSDLHGHVSQCACGTSYVRRRGRVFEVVPGEPPRLVLRWHPRGGWQFIPASRVALPYRR